MAKIISVGVGEYITLFLLDDGTVRSSHWGGYLGLNRDVTAAHSVSGIVKVCGGQYQGLAINGSGQVYQLFKNNGAGGREGTTLIANDYLGNPFNGNSEVYGAFTSFMSLKSGIPYMWGANNFLTIPGWNGNPIPLQVPSGKLITKLVVMEPDNNPGPGIVLALANDGTVYKYNKNGGGVPILQTGLPAGIVDIGAITQFVYFAATASQLWAWGNYSEMVGLPANTTTPTNVTSTYTGVGMQFPLKKICSNWSACHFLDNKNDVYSIGNNPHGAFGTGIQWPNWATKTPDPFAWDFGRGTLPTTTPVQAIGKFLEIWAEGTLSYQLFAMDMGGTQLYSAGRNKAQALANGLEVNNDEGYPEWGNVPFLRKVDPLTVIWPNAGGPAFNPSATPAPFAHAGIDQWVTGTSATLYGGGHQQGTASIPTGSITSYAWSKISGPAGGAITSPTSATTAVTGLATGTYVYRMTVTSNVAGQSGTRDMNMFVTTSNVAPVANAGADKAITLPVTSTSLTGSGSDSDGTIASYAWSQVSGTAATIASPTAATTSITGLTTAGVRVFRLTVTDNSGGTATDDVVVTVSPANSTPTANGGANKSITLPTATTTLNGSGSDSDGTIASYAWAQISGTAATIVSPTSASTVINGLSTAGTRVFRLTVTDNQGATGTSDVTVQVLAANTPPIAEAGSNIQLFLPTNSVQLSGSGGDSDGSIVSYAWSKLSGPAASITDADTPMPILSGLVVGTYVYQLTVTDNNGSTGTDAVTVQVFNRPATTVLKFNRSFKIV